MRIYCDSNVFRKAKKESKQFNEAVYNIMQALKPNFLFLFSEAHMSDLSKSQKTYRDDDLIMMEEYVNNNYICRDHIEKSVKFYLATPIEAYDGYDYQASESFLENPFEAFNDMFDFEGGEQLGAMFKQLFDIQIFPDVNIDTSALSPEYRELANQFQGVKTISDALKKMKGIGAFLDSDIAFKKHRAMLSTYVNRDDYSYDQWSFDFDERMKNTVFGKSFTELVEQTIADMDKYDEYTNFINTYVQLEFFGVTEERSGKKQKLKKNSHLDLHKDASHAFFASKADFFVTDDIGVQTKAFILYKLFNITTQVLSIKDFIARSTLLLKNEDNNAIFAKGLSFSFKNGFIINQSVFRQQTVIKTLYPIFNYFNRLQTNTSHNQQSVQLFKSYGNFHGIMFAEITLLIKKCERIFGPVTDLKETNNLKEFGKYKDGEPIRTWSFNGVTATLSWEKNTYMQRIIVLTLWL